MVRFFHVLWVSREEHSWQFVQPWHGDGCSSHGLLAMSVCESASAALYSVGRQALAVEGVCLSSDVTTDAEVPPFLVCCDVYHEEKNKCTVMSCGWNPTKWEQVIWLGRHKENYTHIQRRADVCSRSVSLWFEGVLASSWKPLCSDQCHTCYT